MTKFYSALLGLLIVAICSCERSGPIDEPVDITLITVDNIGELKHWHGAQGVFERLGSNHEIGALLRYNHDWENEIRIALFDETGKQFINDNDGIVSGPHSVGDFFKITNLWGLKDNYNAGKFADSIQAYGVESAIITEDGDADVITVVTKDGQHITLHVESSGEEIKYGNTALTKNSSFTDGVEAMMDYDGILLIDKSGENIEDVNGVSKGTVSSYWNGIPSKKVEAMCTFRDDNNIPVVVRVLGADGNISNGRYLYISYTDTLSGPANILVDLQKE